MVYLYYSRSFRRVDIFVDYSRRKRRLYNVNYTIVD